MFTGARLALSHPITLGPGIFRSSGRLDRSVRHLTDLVQGLRWRRIRINGERVRIAAKSRACSMRSGRHTFISSEWAIRIRLDDFPRTLAIQAVFRFVAVELNRCDLLCESNRDYDQHAAGQELVSEAASRRARCAPATFA